MVKEQSYIVNTFKAEPSPPVSARGFRPREMAARDSLDSLCCASRNVSSQRIESDWDATNVFAVKSKSPPVQPLSLPTNILAIKSKSPPVQPPIQPLQSPRSFVRSPSAASLNKEPDPLKGWTKNEQDILISEVDRNPKARKNDAALAKLLEHIRVLLPGKSIKEVQECYRHVSNARVAYFRSGPPAKPAGP